MPSTGARRGHLVYHWRHGWIPLDHFAALSKAHHSKSGAVKVMEKHGIEVPRGYRDDHTPKAASGDHFRMSGRELHDRAAKGDHAATAELARRAARKNAAGGKVGGKKSGVPFRPPTKPAEPKTATPKAAAPKPPAPKAAPEAPAPPRPPVKTPEPPKVAAPKAPEPPKVSDRWTKPLPAGFTPTPPRTESTATHAERVAKARRDFGAGSDQHKSALESENTAISEALSRWPSAGPGHTIRTTVMTRNVVHRQELPDQGRMGLLGGGKRTIGKVYEANDAPGTFSAHHTAYRVNRKSITSKDTPLGQFATREEAHKAIAVAETRHANAEIDKRSAKAQTLERKAQRVAGIPGPHGTTWEPATEAPASAQVSRGRIGAAVEAKARQTFKAGNKTVTIEANLSDANTRQLLHDVTAAVDATPLRDHEVHFVVPTGHEGFQKGAGGFVYAGSGGRTVYVNPSLANHKKTTLFTQGHENDWHMPASADLGRDSNVPTLVHELGHVHDNIHGHTRSPDQRTPSGFSIGMGFQEGATVHHRDLVQNGKLTRYARKNPAEGYAEAFMQYHVAGHGSHPAADEYAQRYGWARTEGIAPKGASQAGIAARDARMAQDAEKHADRLRVARGEMTRGDFGEKWNASAAPPMTVRLQAAESTLGAAYINRITHGAGLSRATPAQRQTILRALQRARG